MNEVFYVFLLCTERKDRKAVTKLQMFWAEVFPMRIGFWEPLVYSNTFMLMLKIFQNLR